MTQLIRSFLLFAILFQSCSKDTSELIPLPVITSLSATKGSSEMLVIIEGNNFGDIISKNIVKFNGYEATILSIVPTSVASPNGTFLKVLVPNNCGTGPVTVTTGGKTGVGPIFTYVEPISTPSYFINFKANNVLNEFKIDTDPGYNYQFPCAGMSIYPNPTINQWVSLSACFENNVVLNDKLLLSLKGKTLPLRNNAGYPYARFGYYPYNPPYLFDSSILNNLYSDLTITDVVYQSSSRGANAYNVSGTFSGIIQNEDMEVITVTEGTFLIRISIPPY